MLPDINWKEIVIEINDAGSKLGTRSIIVRELMPKQVADPQWYDFDYQTFLLEFEIVYADVTSTLGGTSACSLTYTNKLNGRRLEILRNGVVNKHDYAMMFKDFSTSRSPEEDTI